MSVVLSSAPDRLRPSTSLNVRRRPRFGAVRARHAEIFPLRIVDIFVRVANIFDWIVNVYLFKHAPSCQKFRFGAERAQHAEIFPRRIVILFLQVANTLIKIKMYILFNLRLLASSLGLVRWEFGILIFFLWRLWIYLFELQIYILFYLRHFTGRLGFWCGASSMCWDFRVVNVFVQIMNMKSTF